MRSIFFKAKMEFRHVLILTFLSALFCVVLVGGGVSAAHLEIPAAGEEISATAPLDPERLEDRSLSSANGGNERGRADTARQGNILEENSDDELLIARVGTPSAGGYGTRTAQGDQLGIAAGAESPPTPPPDKIVLAANNHALPAAASGPNPAGPEKNGSAPGPKTSKNSSLRTPLLVTTGVVLAVGAAVAAGSSGSGDSSSPDSTNTNPGGTSTGATDVIPLADLVRLGDDNDYNGNHPDHFRQNRPSGLSWTESFTINNANTVGSARFKYTVAGSKVGNPIFINGQQAGRLCNPGNLATNVRECSLGILGHIRSGANEIRISVAIDRTDTTTPFDDVELYNLRIELTR